MSRTSETVSSLRAAIAQAEDAAREHQLRISVIVPVFNNGEQLRTRAFPSLRATEGFSQLHVLLVDDGSTYQDTREAVADLAAGYPNVTAYFHSPGGSGSASRPRNTGLQLAHTRYVTYLDPDDEAHPAGYQRLAEQLDKHSRAQFALGNQITVDDEGEEITPNHQYCAPLLLPGSRVLHRGGSLALRDIKFRPSSLEAMLLRTDWLKSTGIEQVPGAAGQDSLFFLQVLQAAEHFTVYPAPIYTYYTNVPGSMVNSLTAQWFAKNLMREQSQAPWLKTTGLLQDYLDTRFEHFMVTWYLQKLKDVPYPQREAAEATLRQIAELYVGDPRKHTWRYPQTMAFFGKYSIPSVQGMRPWAGSLKRAGAQAARKAANRARTLRGSGR